MNNDERENVKATVVAAIAKADDELLRSLLCQVVGHPPVVVYCFGELTCARCGDVVGDALVGAATLENRAIVGHRCADCDTVWNTLTAEQRLLMPDDVVEKFRGSFPPNYESPHSKVKA